MQEADEMSQYWNLGFQRSEKDPGSFYDLIKLPEITQSSHYRRMELLDSLELGDLSDKSCVDFGVGPWGFACIFPKLQHSGEAIGIDISSEALRQSAALSEKGAFPYGKNYKYLQSDGASIPLPNSSIEVFFAGEAIEHVENVEAFLDEIHRVLRSDGVLVLTTPNADAVLYKARNERYCQNGEHVSLMNYAELRDCLDARFQVLAAKGFNGSFFRTLDELIKDKACAAAWAREYEDRPDLATGVVIMAKKQHDYRPCAYLQRHFHHLSPALRYSGKWETLTLHSHLTGRMTRFLPENQAHLIFDGDGVILFFWSHPHSGYVDLCLDEERRRVNLYSPVAGFQKIAFSRLSSGPHNLSLAPAETKALQSLDSQVIFHKALTFVRQVHPSRSENGNSG